MKHHLHVDTMILTMLSDKQREKVSDIVLHPQFSVPEASQTKFSLCMCQMIWTNKSKPTEAYSFICLWSWRCSAKHSVLGCSTDPCRVIY